MDSTYEMVKELIDFNCEGVDTYNHNGSTWLIFTDNKKWVIELTKEKTLWYNYYFFTGVFKYLSLDVVENQHYITKWVEDTIINSVKSTKGEYYKEIQKVEYTIQNGVKYTIDIEDAIENGVKSTRISHIDNHHLAEDTLQNGVKHTIDTTHHKNKLVEDTIQNGVKEIHWVEYSNLRSVEDTIQNGVKKTKRSYEGSRKQRTKDTIQNGVKETELHKGIRPSAVEDTIENGVKKTVPIGIDKDSIVSNDFGMNDAIQNGVKKTYSDKIPHEYDWTGQFIEEIEGIIQNGVKHTEKSLQIDGSCVIEDVLREGVKHTEYGDWLDGDERFDDIIKNGIKETTPGGYLGSVEMRGKTVHQFESPKQNNEVEDVIESGIKQTCSTTLEPTKSIEYIIENGIKKTEAAALFDEESKMDTVISNGIKETHDDAYHHTGRVDGVIKNGVKKTEHIRHLKYNPMDFSAEYSENRRLPEVTSVLEKGIKEVQPLPSQEGNKDWGNYYHKQEDRTKPHTKYVDDVITNGIKKTKAMDEWVNTDRIVDGVISNGVKKSPI
jgi:hypothetical protein